MIDVVSPPRSLGIALKLPVLGLLPAERASWAPQLEQYLAPSGFGRPHRAQYIAAMAWPGLPSRCTAGSRSIASGDAVNGTRAEGSGSTRHENRRRRAP